MLFKKKGFLSTLYIFFLILFIFLIQFSTNNVYGKTYKIKEINIIEPYDLDFNKIKIFDKAFEKAFKKLILKITRSDDQNKLKNPSLKKIKTLVDSFNIINEKFVEKNYYADFEVEFNKKKVLRYLEKQNIYSSIPIKKKVFILPILVDIEKNDVFLFSENLFYINWNKNNEKHFLLTYVLPNEDLDDIKLIQEKIGFIEEYKFNEIIKKYNLKDYIIVILFKNKNSYRVLSKINFNKKNNIINSVYKNVNINSKEQVNDLIYDLKSLYENSWKKQNLINTSFKLPLTLSIDSYNTELIVKFEDKLNKLDLVSNYSIDKFSSEKIIFKVVYNSTPDKFLSEFRSMGFEIDTSSKAWKIK